MLTSVDHHIYVYPDSRGDKAHNMQIVSKLVQLVDNVAHHIVVGGCEALLTYGKSDAFPEERVRPTDSDKVVINDITLVCGALMMCEVRSHMKASVITAITAMQEVAGRHDIAQHTRNAGYISKQAAIKWPRQWTGFLEIRRNLEDRVKEGAAYELRPQACRALAMLHALDKIDAFDADFWAQKTEDVKYWSSDETCNRGFVS